MVGTDEAVLDEGRTPVIAPEPTDPTLPAMEALVSLFFECFFFDHAPIRLEVIVLNGNNPDTLSGVSFDPEMVVELMEQFQFSLWRTSMMTTEDVGVALRRMLEPILRAFVERGIVLSSAVTAHAATQDDSTVLSLFLHLG